MGDSLPCEPENLSSILDPTEKKEPGAVLCSPHGHVCTHVCTHLCTHVLSPHYNEIIIIVKIIFKELRRNKEGEGRRRIRSRNPSRKQSQPQIHSARSCARGRQILPHLPECCCALSPAQSGCTAADAALCAFNTSVHLFHNPTPQQRKQSSAI